MREEYMIERQGKRFVLYAGLLEEAHSRGLRSIETDLLQVPDAGNGEVAIVRAVVRTEDGKFTGIGDASPENVGRNIVPHVIRMAETRAKARALRDAVNVGATALEELSDGDDAPPADNFGSQGSQGSPRSRPTPIRNAAQRGSRAEEAPAQTSRAAEDNGKAEEASAPVGSSRRGASGKARKSQVDLLKTLAVEWRGENGVERLENRVGKPLADLTRTEADEWIDRLTPEGR